MRPSCGTPAPASPSPASAWRPTAPIKGEEETQFHTIVCWDRLAETTAEYVKKGDPLYVEGRLQYRSFQDEEGKERGVCEIVADDVQFLSRRGTGRPAGDTPDDLPA